MWGGGGHVHNLVLGPAVRQAATAITHGMRYVRAGGDHMCGMRYVCAGAVHTYGMRYVRARADHMYGMRYLRGGCTCGC